MIFQSVIVVKQGEILEYNFKDSFRVSRIRFVADMDCLEIISLFTVKVIEQLVSFIFIFHS
jgi:hypothetical protein